ncbi:MAG: DUF4126 family protein [Longimicrobiales bacterium]|nr:DUF4126 family protein [Longimicrobiales bacterium]
MPPFTVDPGVLAFLTVLAAAGGADLALTVLVLAVAPGLGWDRPPGDLPALEGPAVAISVLLLYGAEAVLERFPAGYALWHTFQLSVRVVGLVLLGVLATAGLPGPERALLVAAIGGLGTATYLGASGWGGVSHLRRRGRSSELVAALATDVAFAGLLILALDEPVQALTALGLLLLVAAPQLPGAVRARRALVRAGRSWLRALVLPGRWVPEDELPAWIRNAAGVGGGMPGRPLRGARATLLDDRVRTGWLVLATDGPRFLGRGATSLRLSGVDGSPARTGPLHVRKDVVAGGDGDGRTELLVLRDGPGARELDAVIPSG